MLFPVFFLNFVGIFLFILEHIQISTALSLKIRSLFAFSKSYMKEWSSLTNHRIINLFSALFASTTTRILIRKLRPKQNWLQICAMRYQILPIYIRNWLLNWQRRGSRWIRLNLNLMHPFNRKLVSDIIETINFITRDFPARELDCICL